MTKSYQISPEMDIKMMPCAMYFSGSIKAVTKTNQVPYQTIEYDEKGMFQAKLMDCYKYLLIMEQHPLFFPWVYITNTQYCKCIQKLKVTLLFICTIPFPIIML